MTAQMEARVAARFPGHGLRMLEELFHEGWELLIDPESGLPTMRRYVGKSLDLASIVLGTVPFNDEQIEGTNLPIALLGANCSGYMLVASVALGCELF
ncbi:hypothetical protein HGA91_05535 [candidate division WWE3 bacterium]|nr:hypothetical protein [candidate division WWE3 bacterium]